MAKLILLLQDRKSEMTGSGDRVRFIKCKIIGKLLDKEKLIFLTGRCGQESIAAKDRTDRCVTAFFLSGNMI